jgi:hypothetical protein
MGIRSRRSAMIKVPSGENDGLWLGFFMGFAQLLFYNNRFLKVSGTEA